MRYVGVILLWLFLAVGAEAQTLRGFDPANMDTSASPCTDFYQYAVGGWIERTTIPPDYAVYGVDQEVEARTLAVVKEILEAAARDETAPVGSEQQKVGDFFAAGMDEPRIEREDLRPLAPLFARIESIRDRRALAAVIAGQMEIDTGAVMAMTVGPDDRNSRVNILQLSQGGLGLPDRDFYVKQDDASSAMRGAYRQHVTRMFVLLGDAPEAARRHAAAVLRLETRLARASMTRDELDDPVATYHKLTASAFAQKAGGFAWPVFFKAMSIGNVKEVVVRQPLFFREMGRMARELPLSDWKAYLRWHLIRSTAAYVSSRFVNEAFAFNGTVLEGAKELPPRWKRVLKETDLALGEALGKLYVERAFGARAKQRAVDLVTNIQAALRARIQRLDWMAEATKMQALAKLDAMRTKIGYPDVWRDYSRLAVDRTSYVMNVLAARTFEFRRTIQKLGTPVDRSEWSTTPITINAFYDPTLNELVFPAAILQTPYFDPEADDAANYGNIGATIGHELTHGFDDNGRQYDAEGNLRDWWTADDAKAFADRAAVMVKQFDAFEPMPGLHVDGSLTLGENLADLGGLIVAYEAFKTASRDTANATSADQRFFLNYAETWRVIVRPELARARLITDEHAPAKYRVNGPLSNMPAFADAFACRPGDSMVRPAATRVILW